MNSISERTLLLIDACLGKLHRLLPNQEAGSDFSKRGVANLYLPYLDFEPTSFTHGTDLDLEKLYEESFPKEKRRPKGVWFTPLSLANLSLTGFKVDGRVVDLATGTGRLLIPFINIDAVRSHKIVGIEKDPLLAFIAKTNFISILSNQGHKFDSDYPIEIPVYNTDSLADMSYRESLFWDEPIIIDIEGESFSIPSYFFSSLDNISSVRSSFGSLSSRVNDYVLRESEDRFNQQFSDEKAAFFIRNKIADALVPHYLHQSRQDTKLVVLNPPWVSYRLLEPRMQEKLKQGLQKYGFWKGKHLAPQVNLSLLFVIVGIDIYLAYEGEFMFFLPSQIMTNDIYEAFQQGNTRNFDIIFNKKNEIPISESNFPVNAIFLQGKKKECSTSASPYSSKTVIRKVPKNSKNIYGRGTFRNGATLFPKALIVVDEMEEDGDIVAFSTATRLREKPPWRDLPRYTREVEKEFLHPIIEGGFLLPFSVRKYSYAVLPVDASREILALEDLGKYRFMGSWWREAEGIWAENRTDKDRPLIKQIDHMKKLTKQLESNPSNYKVVYSASGRSVSASVVEGDAIATHSFYWASFERREEAYYISAILNSKTALSRMPTLERHIDKSILDTKIPIYIGTDVDKHLALLGEQAHQRANFISSQIGGNEKFRSSRDLIRGELSDLYQEIEELTTSVFDTK
jgi:hypothetical protein